MRSLAPVFVALCACSSNPRLSVPPELSDGDAVVFYIAVEDEDPVLYAADVAGEDIVVPIDLEPGQRVETELAIYDDRELTELQLPPGLVTFETEGAPLPEPSAHYALTTDGPPAQAPFSPLAWSSSRLAEARLSRSLLACLEARRCLTAEGLCVACAGPEQIDPPMSPSPVEVTCPTGWTVNTIANQDPPIQICDPRIAQDRFDCPLGEARKLGDDACTRVGRACPAAGRFAEGVTGLFVDPTAAAGGDGTLAAPYRTLDEALDVADGSAPILLSVGRHTSATRNALLDAGTAEAPITIRGACATETTLAGGFDGMRSHLRLEDLAVDASGAFYVGAGGSVALEGVALESTVAPIPIYQSNGALLLRDVVADSSGGFVHAVESSVVVDGVVARAVDGHIVEVTGGPSATVRDAVFVSGRRERPLLRIDEATLVQLQRVAFEEAVWTAVHIDGGESASIEDLFFRTESGVRFPTVFAVVAHRINASLRRVWVQGALGLFHLEAQLDVSDVVVNPDSPGTTQGRPAAIWMANASSGALRRAVVYDARRRGIQLEASNVVLTDIRVQGVTPEEGADPPDFREGTIGIYITGEPATELSRVVIQDVEGVALAQATGIASIGRELRINDLDVSASGPTSCYARVGGFIAGATNYVMTRARLADLRGPAIGMDLVSVGGVPALAAMVADHITVSGVTRIPECPDLPGAIVIAEGAQLDLRNFEVGSAAAPGIVVRPNTVNAVDHTLLDGRSGRIHDVSVGIRYEVADPRLDALVDVKIEPSDGGAVIEHIAP